MIYFWNVENVYGVVVGIEVMLLIIGRTTLLCFWDTTVSNGGTGCTGHGHDDWCKEGGG